MAAVAAFEVGNSAATLLILRACDVLTPEHVAGILRSTVSPTAAFAYLTVWMVFALVGFRVTARR